MRRLALEVQHLGRERPPAHGEAILSVIRDLGALQLDPSNAVAPGERLVLFSRIGPFDARLLDRMLWRDRSLFEYFAHAASMVPVSDLPIHRVLMRTWGAGDSAWDRRVRVWMEANRPLRDAIRERLSAGGGLRTGEFEPVAGPPWASTGWPIARNVDRMLEFLWIQGVIVPAGRWRSQRVWDLMERWLPGEPDGAARSAEAATRMAIERSLRSLGVATERHIDANFTRYRYPNLAGELRDLEANGRILRVVVRGAGDGPAWAGTWWLHGDHRPLLARVQESEDAWAGRTTLLASLDNLIADRQRAVRLFGLRFGQQRFVPDARRGEQTSVLLILDGDRFLGRVHARYDRVERALIVSQLILEPNAPRTAAVAGRVRAAFEELGTFLGAAQVRVEATVPERWRRTMAS